jgi:superfamily II DNA or RNA helicase
LTQANEFHHAEAPSYQKLLDYYEPKILLGLTATPDRMDGKNILERFDDRIAAEMRLPEALSPGNVNKL